MRPETMGCMYSIQIEIPTQATDANKTSRGNKFVHSAVRQKIKMDIANLTKGKRPEKPLEKFKISITRYGARTLDWDNLVASFKGHLDGLTKAGIIKGDSWKYIRQINTDQKISTEKKLVITVEEVE